MDIFLSIHEELDKTIEKPLPKLAIYLTRVNISQIRNRVRDTIRYLKMKFSEFMLWPFSQSGPIDGTTPRDVTWILSLFNGSYV